MQIGNYTLKNNVILAPMAGITDSPFRRLCKEMGAGMTVSEMVSSNSLLWGSTKTLRRACHDGTDSAHWVQILGADPKLLAKAAQHNVDNGAEIIDINMGCPAKKVCNTMAGSALLKDENLVADILETVVNSVEVPVTLKIRTGWDKEHRNGLRIAKIAEQAGIQALSVHGRTRACKFTGEAEYDTIANIKANSSIPIIANGDIDSPEKAKYVLDYTDADGIMIGRAAFGRPWLFQEIVHYLQTGTKLPSPTVQEIRDILLKHLESLYQFYGEYTGIRMARKHLSWYSKRQRNGAAFRNVINRVDTSTEQISLTKEFFARSAAASEVVGN
ncbi:tRNA dihydrouridine synthase DusB [Candidatus Halobeggiatoa sp. HSG11]|nr:tRNA dihydrouridine synthase DusB [Candidatus Halobeggiatoa sp. HSG11]